MSEARSTMLTVRRLTTKDLYEYGTLRREALAAHPTAFGASLDSDPGLDAEFMRPALEDPTQAVFGAFDGELVGVVGVFRERTPKAAHRAHIWGMYVSPDHRGEGVGRALIDRAIAFARGLEGVRQVHLRVSTPSREARALYERTGFVTWGTEPAAMIVDGEVIDQDHMVLELVEGER